MRIRQITQGKKQTTDAIIRRKNRPIEISTDLPKSLLSEKKTNISFNEGLLPPVISQNQRIIPKNNGKATAKLKIAENIVMQILAIIL